MKTIETMVAISLIGASLSANAIETKYSALVFGDFDSPHAASTGPLAIAGDAYLNGYSIMTEEGEFASHDYSLIVSGDLSYQAGRVYKGSIIAGGSVSDISETVYLGLADGATISGSAILPVDFSSLQQSSIEYSQALSKEQNVGTVTMQWGGIYLEGDCTSDIQVFNLDGFELEKSHTLALNCVPDGASVIVNISGNKENFKPLSNISLGDFTAHRQQTIFNLYEATSLSISGVALEGMVLAPKADIDAPSGTSNVSVIANSWKGSMHLAYHPFNGKLPGSKDVQPISAEVKWQWNSSSFMPEFNQVMITPVVAQLNDDNNDGIISNLDVADVIVTTYKGSAYKVPSIVRALSGIDGSELWQYDSVLLADPRFSPAVADLDGDGVVEVLVADGKAGVLRIANNLGLVQKEISLVGKSAGNISIADINNDGLAEILVGNSVINAAGELVFSHGWSADSISFDSNNDGKQEILAAGSLYDYNGQLLWQFTAQSHPWFSSIANFDNDSQPEIVLSIPGIDTTEHTIALLEHNGNVKWRKDGIKSHGGGTQAVSNFFGGEQLGIVYAGYTSVDMLDANGEIVWQYLMDDMGSGKIGLSSYDFNGNGRDEVIVQDHFKVAIVDGLTGKELFQVANSTATLWEYPIVVDLEGDNNAEMIVVSNNKIGNYNINTGVSVYQSSDNNKPWVNATRIWNQHSFHMTNINQDGTVPLVEENSWLLNNSYRSSTIK